MKKINIIFFLTKIYQLKNENLMKVCWYEEIKLSFL